MREMHAHALRNLSMHASMSYQSVLCCTVPVRRADSLHEARLTAGLTQAVATAAAPAGFQCKLQATGGPNATWLGCVSPAPFTNLTSTTYSFAVRAIGEL